MIQLVEEDHGCTIDSLWSSAQDRSLRRSLRPSLVRRSSQSVSESICKFPIFVMVTCPLSAPVRGLYLPNAWSKALQTSKMHTFRVSTFHRYHWFGGKLFPVGCTQDSRRVKTLKTRKCCFRIWLRPRYKIPEFFTIAPVLTSTLTVCRRNRGGPSSLHRT